MGNHLTDKEFKKRLNYLSWGTITTSDTYVTLSTPLLFKCKVCKTQWNAKPIRLIDRQRRLDGFTGCTVCSYARRGKSRQTPIEEIQENINKFLGHTNYEVIEKSGRTLSIRCNKGHNFNRYLTFSIQGKKKLTKIFYCPKCVNRYNKHTDISSIKKKLKEKGLRLKDDFNEKSLQKRKPKYKFICKHKHITTDTITSILTTGCKKCIEVEKIKLKERKIKEKAKTVNFELLSKVTLKRKELLFRCLVCGEEKQLKNYYHLKCAPCSYSKNSGIEFKRIKLGSRIVGLQGFEPQALKILRQEGIRANYIKCSVSEGKPTIYYRYKNRRCIYVPDFYLSDTNTIVEVKSHYTLGLKKHKREWFYRNKRKAKTCIRLGYNFRLMLIGQYGKEIGLPKDWYVMSRRSVLKYLK